MKNNHILAKLLLAGALSSACAFADISVDKSNGVLTVTSDINGIVIAKIIGPKDEVVVDKRYPGNSFTWQPSGADGTYRYDVKVIPTTNDKGQSKGDYAGGMLKVVGEHIDARNTGGRL